MVGSPDIVDTAFMSHTARIVIIADDLSGAADCAVSCAVQGLRTVVQLSESPSPEAAQVLAIDAATRGVPADLAAATVERIVAAYEHAAYEHAAYEHAAERVLFKKLDSLLRGHIGPELAAMRCGRSGSRCWTSIARRRAGSTASTIC